MQVTLAFKKHKGEWRGAQIIDDAFEDTLHSDDLNDAVIQGVGPVLALEYPDGQEVTVTVLVKVKKAAGGSA